MRAGLEQRLKEEFPFLQIGSGPFEQYGIEVLDGWHDLLYAMCKEIQATGAAFAPIQIKQKFGKQRVYYQSNDTRIKEIVEKYENLSETVCEQCGQPGTYRRERIIVLCDNCTAQCTDKGKIYNNWEVL